MNKKKLFEEIVTDAQDAGSVGNPEKAGVLVFDEKGRMLGCHGYGTAPGNYDIPKGSVDEDEEYEDAAARELKEETGIDVSPDKLRFVAVVPFRDSMIYLYSLKWKNIDLGRLHCDSLIDNPKYPDRNGHPEVDEYAMLYLNDKSGKKWYGSTYKSLKAALEK
jgi:8-oxo-dGTP pyrophosphatase MutT (NUDIX family)